jgi:hypothetical protein
MLKNSMLGMMGVVAVVGIVAELAKSNPHPVQAKPVAAQQVSAFEAQAIRENKCRGTAHSQRAEYDRLMKARQYWLAVQAVRECAEVLNDGEMKRLADEANLQFQWAVAASEKENPYDRDRSLDNIERDFPEDAKRNGTKIGALRASVKKSITAQRRKQDAAEAARKRSEGVRIGMTQQDVLASSWGRPHHINRTTYRWGTHEQWVYGERNYLYFEDGTLTAIQN